MKLFIALASPSLELSKYTGTNGFYSCCIPEEKAKEYLSDISRQLEIKEIDPERFHCTLMYSPKVPTKIAKGMDEFIAVPKSVEIITGHDDKQYMILNLECALMHHQHNLYKRFGCKPTFEDYHPHITLWKFREGNPTESQKNKVMELNKMLTTQSISPMPLRFGKPIISDLN